MNQKINILIADFWIFFCVIAILLFCIFCTGCQKQVILHPIEKSDIFSIPVEALIIFDPNSTDVLTVEKNGWFVSDFYMQEVMEAKIE